MRARSIAAAAAVALAAAAPLRDTPSTLGAVTSFSCTGAQCDVTAAIAGGSGTVPLRIVYYAPSIVRYWLAIDGNWSDVGAFDDVVVGGSSPVTVTSADAGSYYEVTSTASAVTVRLQKSPALLTLLVNGVAVVQEASPLAWNSTSSWQTLTPDVAPAGNLPGEYFFGGGMQNGRWSHRGESITIGVDYNWEDNGHPNSAPWYVSSGGYGVFRNTWQPGVYTFGAPVTTAHNESNRFDAFYMLASTPGPVSSGPGAGSTIREVLGLYTQVTGAPFLPPIYGLYLGDSDCYHNDRHGNSTRTSLAVAQGYRDNDMPAGWMLINDGYGCGYGEPNDGAFPSNLTDLTYVVAQMHTYGLITGLWTSTGMPNISAEVGIAGTRVCKTDVGWIGAGYKYAFDGVTLCAGGIETYSDARRFVWTVEGWAGTHRLAVMWCGDDSGEMDYVRWQVPTFVGSGFSAQAHVSGDIDGIFGGSPESQVRDFQMKALTSVLMVMSGWAANPDKQPWTWGEPYTTINRASLKLKSQLVPYMYSLSRAAFDTGVPPIRSPLLEFPADPAVYAPSNATSYQFMSGPFLLAAPVFEAGATTRDGIYLPAGAQWADWWDGSVFNGSTTLDGYDAPLDKLPIFVRAGAIIPMTAPMNYYNAAPWDPLLLEVWPAGNSTFSLYEDDGVTRAALPPGAAFTWTDIAVSAPAAYLNSSAAAGNVTIAVAAVRGAGFPGALAQRGWWLDVRAKAAPLAVLVAVAGGAASALPEMQSEAELRYAPQGWYFDDSLQRGLLMVKLSNMSTSAGFVVTLSNGQSFPRVGTETCDTPAHHQVENQKFAWDAGTGQIAVVPVPTGGGGDNATQCVTIGTGNDPDSRTPAVEVQPCDPALAARQTFTVLPSKQIALASDATTCLDQDVSDSRVIAYGCHDPSSPGNQAWAINPDGTSQHIVSLQNGLCMAVFPVQ